MKTIFIIGMMGAGKSTIAKKLAPKLGYSFTDIDVAIESLEGKSISTIFADKGEPYFRQKEAAVLRKLPVTNQVVATGGGTPCYHSNMKWMKEHGIVVYIAVDEGILLSRLNTTDTTTRPLLAGLDDDGLKEFIKTKMTERLPYYMQADITYRPVIEPIQQLIAQLQNYIK